uniref:NAD(P)H dehydrogenase 18 n=1 Tax=Melianthus villosus TaxID=377280 RepID=A0A0F7CYR1_9ROSI
MTICSSSITVLSANSVPEQIFQSRNRVRVSNQRSLLEHNDLNFNNICCFSSRRTSTRVNAAGLTQIEPDLDEDPHDRWGINSISQEDFVYGEYDGHPTYNEGEVEKGSFWGGIAEDIAAVESPTGFQGFISWLFLPTVAAAMYFNAPGEYLYIGAALFTIVFCIIEMDKPDKPHNFEPQIYNLERGTRDKLIADYNTMDIWDFNEKYGDLWDFTVTKDDIMKR